MIQIVAIVAATIVFFVLEHVLPGRELPDTPGWYVRAAFLNGCQLGITVLAAVAWGRWFRGHSLFHLSQMPAPVQGAIGWFIGTFVFYWWHRMRHDSDYLWRIFHQVHHSPSRIELLTAFYKHPVEIAADSMLASALLLIVLGASPEGAPWFNVFATIGEFFYHSNLRTPHWWGYFLQRPEHHSIHHQRDLHSFNYGDITWWDRLFGTFRDTNDFSTHCGFPEDHEQRLPQMLAFKDAY